MIIKRTQQKRFPVFCLICCLTCLFCFIGSISAFALQTATPSDADKIRITKIQNEDELLALPPQELHQIHTAGTIFLFLGEMDIGHIVGHLPRFSRFE